MSIHIPASMAENFIISNFTLAQSSFLDVLMKISVFINNQSDNILLNEY